MPNWCNNTVEIRHTDPAMLERVRKGFNEGKLLNEFLPVPEDLQIVAGCVGADDDPKQIALVEAEKRNLEKYGHRNWYDWCVANWGTKWDVGADGYEAQELGTDNGQGLILNFDSAWSPPIDAFQTLVDKFGFSIRAYYYEPGMAFAGIWEDGDDDFYEYGGLNSEQIREELPTALDEMFGISECAAEWEEENKEEENED